jgi:hypothetical protein
MILPKAGPGLITVVVGPVAEGPGKGDAGHELDGATGTSLMEGGGRGRGAMPEPRDRLDKGP